MNKEKLQKQVETMNNKQLICLCKSLIDIYCELEDRKDKAIEELEEEIEQSDGCIYVELPEELYIKQLQKYLDILRGKDNE